MRDIRGEEWIGFLKHLPGCFHKGHYSVFTQGGKSLIMQRSRKNFSNKEGCIRLNLSRSRRKKVIVQEICWGKEQKEIGRAFRLWCMWHPRARRERRKEYWKKLELQHSSHKGLARLMVGP